tara:strand:+ start:16072 stop:16845 length:774 start_codon:yes stop_codon:yes gene_type:complete
MNKKAVVFSLIIGMLFFILAYLRPVTYEAEASIFVPLTLLEQQISQNGMGFGSPAEVDAHIELMRSERVKDELVALYPTADFDYEVSKTRNGAVLVEVEAKGNPKISADIANGVIAITDSLKQAMLVQNVQQSLDFVKSNLNQTSIEMLNLQGHLDSLRFEAVEDSLRLASEVFKYERLYGTEVGAMSDLKVRKERLEAHLKAPAPKSYIIYLARPNDSPAGLPAFLIGILGAALSALGFYVYTILPKQGFNGSRLL